MLKITDAISNDVKESDGEHWAYSESECHALIDAILPAVDAAITSVLAAHHAPSWWPDAFQSALKTIPIGNRLALTVNRYDTDDEHVLQLHGGGVTYDIRAPKASLAAPAPSVMIAGVVERSIANHIRGLEVCIEEEQTKPLPDNALIAKLCDAVRLAREYAAHASQLSEGQLRKGLDAFYDDNHHWSTRPCSTCAAITATVGFPFGCDKMRSRRAPHGGERSGP